MIPLGERRGDAEHRPILPYSHAETPHFPGGKTMPVVTVRITRDGVTAEQKRQVVAEITQTLQRVLGKRPEHTPQGAARRGDETGARRPVI
jgi:Tautomerase enzyme